MRSRSPYASPLRTPGRRGRRKKRSPPHRTGSERKARPSPALKRGRVPTSRTPPGSSGGVHALWAQERPIDWDITPRSQAGSLVGPLPGSPSSPSRSRLRPLSPHELSPHAAAVLAGRLSTVKAAELSRLRTDSPSLFKDVSKALRLIDTTLKSLRLTSTNLGLSSSSPINLPSLLTPLSPARVQSMESSLQKIAEIPSPVQSAQASEKKRRQKEKKWSLPTSSATSTLCIFCAMAPRLPRGGACTTFPPEVFLSTAGLLGLGGRQGAELAGKESEKDVSERCSAT